MSALTALIAAAVAHPQPDEVPASYEPALRALTPTTANAMACDNLELASAFRDVFADAMTNPTEAHEALFAALRSDDFAGHFTLACQLVAVALADKARERAYVAIQRQNAARFWHERRKQPRPN